MAAAWFTPLLGERWLGPIERAAARLGKRKTCTLITIAAAALVLRLALFWTLPIPVPNAHDEFSYLLAADTYAHGRLTNPPHPLSIYFETFHVLQHPTYQSIYPPAQGAVLALGQVLGHPWIGVLLSMTCMCAAITWALQGWLPPQWALLGGILVILRLYLFSYWLESYWGGAVAAIGGALVIGALSRIRRRANWRHALLMGTGAALLATSRPFEGFIFCIPPFAMLAVWLVRCPAHLRPASRWQILLPLFCVLGLTAAFIAYYNWRVTGHALLFPHILNQRQYETGSPFVWGSSYPPRHFSNPQFEVFYNVATKVVYPIPLLKLFRRTWFSWHEFYVGSVLWIPLLALPWTLRDRRTRLLLIQTVLCVLGLLTIIWFFPHYAAPMTATVFAILMQSMRHLRRWTIKGRAAGILLSRVVVLLVLARAAIYTVRPPAMQEAWSRDRARIVHELEATTSDHLVLVRFGPRHNVHNDWVWNAADIDHSRIVWAREIPGVDRQPLLDYFRGRKVWVIEPDTEPPHLKELNEGN